MNKYFVRIAFPDIETSTCPNIQTSFILWAYSGKDAGNRARQFGRAIVADLLRHNRIDTYTTQMIADNLVDVLSIKKLEG